VKSTDPFEPELKYILADKLSLKFRTPEEFGQWFNKEMSFYANIIGPLVPQDGSLQNAWNNLRSGLDPVKPNFDSLVGNPTSKTENYKGLIDPLLQRYASGNLISSDSTWGQYVQQIASSEPALAACLLVTLGSVAFSIGNSNMAAVWLRAGALAEALRNGWLDQKPAADQGLQIFRQEWEGRLQGIELQHQAKGTQLDALIKGFEAQGNKWETSIGSFEGMSAATLTKQDEDTTQAINKGVTDIENFKKTYNAALALRAPTQYWREKRAGHRKASFAWLAAFTLVAVLGVLGVWYVWHVTVEGASREPTYTAFIPSFGAGLLVAWFLRICSRQALSNFALSSDAAERVAMVNTYLALLEGGHAAETDRSLIISALFRPALAPTDDAAPPTIPDLAAKIIRGQKL
jgi:hypothetical protein